ncbi:TrkA C-terminal domain-containing protein [Clostridium sp. LBM24168]
MSSQYMIKPVYQKIAVDIANRIAAGDFSIGDKIYGRSSLASHYNVSPETVRRAIILLNDMDIVEVVKGSGIIVKSVDNCLKFIEKFKEIRSINSIKKEILDIFEQKNVLEKRVQVKINELIDYSNRFARTNPFSPFEFQIYSGLSIIGKTICEIKFWQNTNATIIAIRRKGKLIISPGPYAVFEDNDIFVAVGDEESYDKIKKFIYGNV